LLKLPASTRPDCARFAASVTVSGINISPANANNLEHFVKTTLAYYLDDTPLPNTGYRIKEIARVATLLGPQGALYGAASLGGTERYITNQPKLCQTEAKVNTSIYKTQCGGLSNDTDAAFNFPLGNSFAMRASIARLDESVNVGDRVFNHDARAVSQICDYSFDLVNSNVDVTLGDKSKSCFKVNTSYQFNDNFLRRVTASQSFRRGGTMAFATSAPVL
jgi:outer membrane receptor protein involved in Fe transport